MNKELTKQVINNLIDQDLFKITITDKYIEVNIDRSLIVKSNGHTILYSKDGKLVTYHKETHINPNIDNNKPIDIEYVKENIDDMSIEKIELPNIPREVELCNK